MRNSDFHDKCLAAPAGKTLEDLGAEVHKEFFVRDPRGFIDVFATLGSLRIAVEIELLPRRLDSDISKAKAINATHLLIICPNSRVVSACRKKLKSIQTAVSPKVYCLILNPALQLLREIVTRHLLEMDNETKMKRKPLKETQFEIPKQKP